MAGNRFYKDPNAVLDYVVDWSAWLGDSDAIATSDWIVPEGLTEDSATNTTTTTTIWLSGGTAGAVYTVVNRITTDDGRTEDRSIVISVRDR